LDGASIPETGRFSLLDVLDPDSGFIIASDILPDFAEKEDQSVLRSWSTACFAQFRSPSSTGLSWSDRFGV
jgi:hypothetical protein